MNAHVEKLSVDLVDAVNQNDIVRAIDLVHAGADPFLACAPVNVYVINPGLEMKLGRGCAATQAIRMPKMLAAILPAKMDALPMVTHATSVWGTVCRASESVCLGQWAIEAGAIEGLELLLSRMDRSSQGAQGSLARLLRACARGCTSNRLSDPVYASLLLLLNHRIDLEDDWKDLEAVQINEPVMLKDGLWEYDNVPLVFALMSHAANDDQLAVNGLNWLMTARPQMLRQVLAEPFGWTLLHWAAKTGDVRQVDFALRAGCEPSAPACNGQDAADLAISMGKRQCAAMIHSWCSRKAMEKIRDLGLIRQRELNSSHEEVT